MEEQYITIKDVALNNNCPECYNKTGLRLTFKQKFKENKYYKSITSEIKSELNCNTCNTIIYPVQWTDDIDRVFEYQQKALTPKKASTYLKKISWIIIIAAVVVIAAIVFLVLYPNL